MKESNDLGYEGLWCRIREFVVLDMEVTVSDREVVVLEQHIGTAFTENTFGLWYPLWFADAF